MVVPQAGAYPLRVVDDWDRGEQLVLHRNPCYWGPPERASRRVIVSRVPKRMADSGSRAATPKNAALTGVALASVSWFVLLFAGFGGEKAACPEGDAAWVIPLAVACAIAATLGMAAAVWAYSESAGEPSGEWLLGAAGLYVTALAWTATIMGAVALFFVDVCSL